MSTLESGAIERTCHACPFSVQCHLKSNVEEGGEYSRLDVLATKDTSVKYTSAAGVWKQT